MKILDVLKKPVIAALVGAIVGLIAGLLWAWQIDPVVWKDVPPSQMGSIYQEHYLRMAVDSYRVDAQDQLAIDRYEALGSAGPVILQTVLDNPGSQDVNAIMNFADVVRQGAALPTPVPEQGQADTMALPPAATYIIIGLGALLACLIIFMVAKKFIVPIFRNGTPSTPTAAMRAREMTNQTEMTDYEAMGEEPPISQFVTTYVLGDDLFDDSFSIDAPSGEFLGECGIGISETIGVGEPKKVQAFEVWLFDKNDIQTVTKVLMSAHAFNDVATHQRLEAKGEPMMVERGKQVVLETAALQLVATVSDIEYGQGALPEGSYFERLTLEIAVWPKVVVPG
jgi:hypothetical protein